MVIKSEQPMRDLDALSTPKFKTDDNQDTPISPSVELLPTKPLSTMALPEFEVEMIPFQRILSHPLVRSGFIPESGSEIFVRNLPPFVTDEELLKFFQQAGNIYKIRLMMEDQIHERNRGFCYISYMNAEMAKIAVERLKDEPFKEEHFLTIKKSLENCRLFVGGIPTDKSKDAVWQELLKLGVRDLVDVIMYRAYTDRAQNRGFVFIEFLTHEQAARFRAKYSGVLKLWGRKVIIDWSVPPHEVEEGVLEKVKIIYMRNLEATQTPEELEYIVRRFIHENSIQKVYKFKNYAFIHVATRDLAEKLLDCLKEYYKGGPVEIEWSKPPSPQTSQEYRQMKVSNLSRTRSRTTSSSSTFSGFDDSTHTSNTTQFIPSADSIRERKNLSKYGYGSPEYLQGQRRLRNISGSTEFSDGSTLSNEFLGDYKGNQTNRDIVRGAPALSFYNEKPRFEMQPLFVQTSPSQIPVNYNEFFVPFLPTAHATYQNTSYPFQASTPRSNPGFYPVRSSTPNSISSPGAYVGSPTVCDPFSTYRTRMSSQPQNFVKQPSTIGHILTNEPTTNSVNRPSTSRANEPNIGRINEPSCLNSFLNCSFCEDINDFTPFSN